MTRFRFAAVIPIVAGALLGACATDPLTQLLVVVDSNLSYPTEIDRVVVEIRAGGQTQTSGGPLSSLGTTPLPRTVSLLYREGPLGPIEIHAAVLRGGTEVLARDVRTSFVAGETRVLRIALDRACLGVTCAPGTTCDAGACRSVDVPSAELLVYPDGTGPRMDDGGRCTPVPERCNGMDEDCDGRIDEGVDVSSDPTNCGACGTTCPTGAHATPACAGGVCGLACERGFDDCDGDPRTGCEADLASPAACGSCDNPCDFENATATCSGTTCAFEACIAGFGDCNDDLADGCEVDLATTAVHCGACGAECLLTNATAGCAGGACVVTDCALGFGDCDDAPETGCEEALTSLAHCAACDTPCAPANATGTCATGTCAIATCDAAFGDCDLDAASGCETPLTTLTDCGACGRACSLTNATETCATGTCLVLACDAGWGNCDGVASNGCEANLRTSNAHCGMCGMACTLPDRCRTGVCR